MEGIWGYFKTSPKAKFMNNFSLFFYCHGYWGPKSPFQLSEEENIAFWGCERLLYFCAKWKSLLAVYLGGHCPDGSMVRRVGNWLICG